MLKVFLAEHIKDIASLNSKNGVIVIYKGFPFAFVNQVSKHFSRINSEKEIFEHGYLSIEKIKSLSKSMIKKILTINSGIYVITYEEFLAVANEVKLSLFDLDFFIIENNFYSEIPIKLFSHFSNLDRVVEKMDFSYKEDATFNNFYVYSSEKFNIQLVNYKDIDQEFGENVHKINFFNEKDYQQTNLESITIEENKILPTDILFNENNEKYFNLKYLIFNPQVVKSKTVIISDPVSLQNETLIKELKILKFIFQKNNKQLFIKITSAKEPEKFRNDFIGILKQYWKSDNFRELVFYKDPNTSSEKYKTTQGYLIEEIVQEAEKAYHDNNFRDIFVTAPTGAGKSILFQIPAIYLAKKYNLVSIIVSPLKALMYDQVKSLRDKGINIAAFINSDISLIDRENIVKGIKNGKISILYLSPELLLSYDVRQFIGDRKLGLLVIDEAHLVTTWGRDFRVDYWYLGTYIKRLRKYLEKSKFPVLGLTATAVYSGRDDIVFETVDSLNMRTPKLHIGNVRRNEISFDIRKFLYKGSHEVAKIENTKKIIIDNVKAGKKTIVYFPWINQIKFLMDELPKDIKNRVGIYYGDVDKTEKQIVQDKFLKNEIVIVLATKAFGMGIDVSDIEIIYHHAPSGNLSDYIQEVGRVARKPNLNGYAITDFNELDLKFTKILYGLSSIKQYQVKFVLQKINDLFTLNKRRQMLVSVEDFGFIFSDKYKNYETKVKSALLLLEKDLQNKVNNQYNVIMVRPKALFSIVYACIPNSIEKKFIGKYGPYCKEVATVNSNRMLNYQDAKISGVGNVYEISLDKIWIKYFDQDSFPIVKRKFFDKNLFTEFNEQPFPRYKLKIVLNKTSSEVLNIINERFQQIQEVFHDFLNMTFSELELQRALLKKFNNEVLARRVANLITNLYSSVSEFGEIGKPLNFDTFLQTKKDNKTGGDKYRLISNKYIRIIPIIIRKFKSMFTRGDETEFEKFISINVPENEYRIKIAYLIESFLLGNYEIQGGQLSQIFIRINEPYKLKLFATDQRYSNLILQEVENRHRRSVETMEHFFKSTLDHKQRWDFIENYFLGKEEVKNS